MMSVCTYSLLRRICLTSGRRTYTTATATKLQNTEIEPFRTFETYPPNHTESHLGRIYTVPFEDHQVLQNNIPNEWKQQIKIFAEFGILIRKPAVEIISYLEQTDYTRPINKYVIYGRDGVGKTSTILHLIHYGLAKKFIVLHVPSVNTWFRFPKEIANSPLEPDKIDLTIHAGTWLKYFKNLNAPVFKELHLEVSKDYTWSARESTKCGESLSNLIDFGIHRLKFACGVIDALVNELKGASIAGKCKVLTVMTGFNALTADYTSIRDENKVHVPPKTISLTKSLLSAVNQDWCNGAAILSVDTRAVKYNRESIYPKYLLGKEGFELLDPFLPISIENYTQDEFNTIIEYYKDRKWIREITPEGVKELELLSNRNPYDLWHYCKPL
ncbi:PREDICTED: 28S ribosomal protein S29, mitochondrial [Dufourea novaeangliae]|uniref:Small ribosomal subunit protein mS29 n=1 Tax=Dufourea novaeangliae TaxID=178035 RepID=A0A154P6D2_DUFNO|nr:PREDICTED: 28S ribosomal protein S29, mitochondrial [Dufourea novaeangliae]KZC07495.1 28S ribosomal protein S29, mitochondrial [Dufourea novaeangliae]